MALRCILVPTRPGLEATHRLDTALRLCRSLGAHIRVLFMSREPHGLLTAMPDVVKAAGVTADSLDREFQAAAGLGRANLDAWCTRKHVERNDVGDRIDAVFATWEEEVGEVETILAVAGRVTDVTLVDKPEVDVEFTERAFDTAVFSTGRPVLVVPRSIPDDPLRHVVVAWNGSLEAARVIGQSLDMLRDAERVSIIHVDSPLANRERPAELGDYLRWHGIVTSRLPVVSTGDDRLGEAILDQVRQQEATMLVMGAYTHSRVRRFLLGGVTRHVLDHAEIPLLMAH